MLFFGPSGHLEMTLFSLVAPLERSLWWIERNS